MKGSSSLFFDAILIYFSLRGEEIYFNEYYTPNPQFRIKHNNTNPKQFTQLQFADYYNTFPEGLTQNMKFKLAQVKIEPSSLRLG